MADQLQDADDDDVVAQINIIPFVDISLVLLVIFLCTSTIIAKAAFLVDLPHAASAGDAVESTANVVVSAEGKFFLNGNPVTGDGLRDSIVREAAAHPKLRAVVAADRTVAYDKVVEAIDLIRQGGVSSFALNVDRKAAPAR